MKSKKLSLISLSILSLVLLVSFVSATIEFTEISGNESNINHGESITINFKINNTETTQVKNIIFTLPSLSSEGEWTEAKWGATSYTIDSSNQVDFGTEEVLSNQLSDILSFTFQTEKYNISGNEYTGEITFEATDGSSSPYPASELDTLNLLMNISESKSLSVSDATIPEGSNSTTITIKNEGNTDLTNINLSSTGDFNVNFSSDSIASLTAGSSSDITVTVLSDLEDEVGAQSVTITATADDNTTASGEVSTDLSFCGDCETLEELELDITDLTVKTGFGDDDYWYPFDVIEAEIEVKNDGNYDMEDIEVSWALYDDNGNKIIDGEESDFNLDSDEEETMILTFTLDDDVEDLSGVEQVTLYVKSKGKIDDSDSSNDGEDTCAEDSSKVDLITDDEFMIINDMGINSLNIENWELKQDVSCNSELQIVADVWNIGDDDLEDVSVRIYNNELGISKFVEIGDVDSFDSEKLETTITLPEDAEEKYYALKFAIYDEDGDVFETDEEDEDSSFDVLIKVAGNCELKTNIAIASELVSGGNAGEELSVKATLSNSGDSTETYVLNVKDYEGWATFNELDSNSITLNSGESVEVQLTFNVNKDVTGDKTFNLEVVSSDGAVKTQPMTVSITENSLIDKIKGQNKWYIWAIGALNVLLILAIIVVAIRVTKE